MEPGACKIALNIAKGSTNHSNPYSCPNKWLPDVVLVQRDVQVTTIDLTAPSIQVARGSVQVDGDGTRQATLLLQQGTQAQLVYPDGSTQPMTTLKKRGKGVSP